MTDQLKNVESNAATAVKSQFNIADAVASGAVNERELIIVLTEMCRCVLAARRKRLNATQPVDAPRVIA